MGKKYLGRTNKIISRFCQININCLKFNIIILKHSIIISHKIINFKLSLFNLSLSIQCNFLNNNTSNTLWYIKIIVKIIN